MRIFTYTQGNPESHKELGKKLAELNPGNYTIEVKKIRAVRSISANRYYHFILNIIAIETGHDHDELHEAMKMKFNSKMVFFPKGGSQAYGQSTSNLDSAEFSAYLNRVKSWALNEFGIVIPEMEDVTIQLFMESENIYEQNQNG